ncbi:Mg2+ transporter -like Zinc transport protein [Rutstroemia sp. NJR-2017a BBW]|nr:Mg2+ transporter -like Zinc transport protein [Rutstroemia sp. NJR-2017a BBW]
MKETTTSGDGDLGHLELMMVSRRLYCRAGLDQELTALAEICYNLRYIDRNGKSQNPWSLRQMGIYEQYDLVNQRSRWILLHPSENACRRLEELLEQRCDTDSDAEDIDNIALHAAIMITASRLWGDYLDDQSELLRAFVSTNHSRDKLWDIRGYLRFHNEIRIIDSLNLQFITHANTDEKANYSTIDQTRKFDYKITFSDTQKLHRLRTELSRNRTALKSFFEIASKFKQRYSTLRKQRIIPGSIEVEADLEAHIDGLRVYINTASSLLQKCEAVDRLLTTILRLRNQAAILRNEQTLQEIARQSQSENAAMARLAQQSAQDSRFLKALTVLATLYLPASLLATIFSSNLVQTQTISSSSPSPSKTHLVAAPDFWIYVVITLPLTLFTVLLIYWMGRRVRTTATI